MSRPRRVRRVRQPRVKPPREFGPTPETAAKLRPDVIEALHRAGALHAEQVNAAEQIRTVWFALQKSTINRRGYGMAAGDGGQAPDPLAGLSGATAALWSRVWRPWADELGRIRVATRDGPSAITSTTALAVTLDVVADNLPPTAATLPVVTRALDRWRAIDRDGRRERGRRRAPGGAA